MLFSFICLNKVRALHTCVPLYFTKRKQNEILHLLLLAINKKSHFV